MKKKILSILLVLTMSFALVSCNKDKVSSESGESTVAPESQAPVQETEHALVKNGSTDYEVLYPASATTIEITAVSEFVNFFKEATNVDIRTVSDDKMVENGKYISIGYTKLLDNAGFTYSVSELRIDGFKLKTLDDDLYIFGASDYGTIYGVYEALGYLFDFEYFYNNCYRLEKGITNLKLLDLDVKEIPDIEYRATGYGSLSNNNLDCYRLRMRPYPEFFIPVNGLVFHNSIKYVEDSPEFKSTWLASSGDQLCYTAGGSEEELQKMLDASLETLKSHLKSHLYTNVVTYTIEDNHNFCSCDACRSVVDEYNGANSAVVILYLNRLNAMVRDWFTTEEGKPYERDLDIVFFAYNATTDAPVVFNEETQKYEGINGLKLDKGVSVMYAPIAADFTTDLTQGNNAQYYKTAKQWSDISNNMYLWLYSTNFSHYLVTYDSFDGIAENYRIAKEVKTRWIFDQAQWNEYGFSTGWSNLKSYVNAKLSWDTSLDMDTLVDEFFTTYFGPAEKEMRDIFTQMRTLTTYNKVYNRLGGLRSIYQDVMKEKFWPKNVLLEWLDIYDEAIEKLELLKQSSPESYRRYYKHIAGERLSALYLFVSLYGYNTDATIIKSYQAQFKADAESLGITLTAEGNGTIASLIKTWGF